MANEETGLLRIYIKITQKEHEFVKEVADVQNTPVSNWLREAIGCKLERDGFNGSNFFVNPVSEGE